MILLAINWICRRKIQHVSGVTGAIAYYVRRSPWPPDVRPPNADDILALARRLSAHNIPARVKPDHQETQALQVEVAGHRGKLKKRKPSGAKKRLVWYCEVWYGMVWGMVSYGMGMVSYGVRYSTIWNGMIWYDIPWYVRHSSLGYCRKRGQFSFHST